MSDNSALSRLDLNLLVSLDALLTERSVTRAAESLHLSQPALSASLARLRRAVSADLLVTSLSDALDAALERARAGTAPAALPRMAAE